MANDQTVYGASTYSGGVYSPYTATPDGVAGTETVGAPTVTQAVTTAPASLVEPGTVGQPNTGYAGTIIPSSLQDIETAGAAVAFTTTVAPTSVADTATYGSPQLTQTYNGYSSGVYGTGTYGGVANTIAPASIGDTDTIGQPAATGGTVSDVGYGAGTYGNGTYPGTTRISPISITDPETVGTPGDAGNAVPTNTGYGAGPYGDGTYPGAIKDPGGAGIFAVPVYGNPTHVLAIGPWNSTKVWRGAKNYGISSGVAPARPHLQLPGVQSKSFTLRLYDGGEASASLQFARTGTVIVQEMATDLWWQRIDPRTGKLEMIGRFNTSHNDLSRADDGTVASALQFVDYRTILSNRMVLKYLTTTYATDGSIATQTSIWPTATPITKIMRFFVPTDLGLDIGALDNDDLLGATTTPFDLPPATTLDKAFNALLAISPKPWEWWVDTPTDTTLPPSLRFIVGTRGNTNGVVLADIGTGPSPIASWTMRATSDSYANTVYFQGSAGGVVTKIPAQVTEYGERDIQYSDNTIGGNLDLLKAAARSRLAKLADRDPTFTIVLRAGFWRGPSHIGPGDTITLRIHLGGEALDYTYRVTELQCDVDANGLETVTLTLGNPLASVNGRSQQAPFYRFLRTLRDYETPTNSTTNYDYDPQTQT